MKHLNICLLLFCVLSSVAGSHKSKQYLICKSVPSLFPSGFDSALDGSDAERINHNGGDIDSEADFHEMNRQLKAELKSIKEQLKCYDGIVVDSICYRLLYRVGVKVTFNQAENLCAFHDGEMLEVPNQKVYNAIIKYIRRTWSIDLTAKGRNFVQVFLHSQYRSGVATLRNGDDAFIHWHPRYPTSNPNHHRLLISVTLNTQHPPSEIGMFNYNPAYTAIPLCQFPLE